METCPTDSSVSFSQATVANSGKTHNRSGSSSSTLSAAAIEKDDTHSNTTPDPSPSLWVKMSKYMKYMSLLVLVFQNTALVLTMRYSRTGEGPKYLASTAVVLAELLKFTICFGMICYEHDLDLMRTFGVLGTEVLGNMRVTVKLSIPSILYTIQNNLLYLALSHLDAATFQVMYSLVSFFSVTYQLKILTTALFSVVLLNRKLTGVKWVSLVILMLAVALVQFPTDGSNSGNRSSFSSVIGVSAVLLACISSGFSGVFIEKILKESDVSMWIRNIQLSLLSFGFGLFGVLVTDWSAVYERGFFQGYSTTVGIVISLQAVGGLVVAAVMKYADNILKGFATSVSIVLSSIISYFFLADFHPSLLFLIGAFLVLVATFMYSKPHATAVLPQTDPKGS